MHVPRAISEIVTQGSNGPGSLPSANGLSAAMNQTAAAAQVRFPLELDSFLVFRSPTPIAQCNRLECVFYVRDDGSMTHMQQTTPTPVSSTVVTPTTQV